MRKKGKLKGKPCIELAEGEATVMLRCRDDDAYANAKQTFSVIETGYALLAQNYPQFVDIKSVG
jgi:L-fucose mutarotase/ribose pyranase (RbsD/FucU family)